MYFDTKLQDTILSNVRTASIRVVAHEIYIGIINCRNLGSSKVMGPFTVYSHYFMEMHKIANQNLSELTSTRARTHTHTHTLLAMTLSSVRCFQLSPARVEDAGNVDRQARKPPAKRNVLVAHSRGYRPQLYHDQHYVRSSGKTRQSVSFRTTKKNAFKERQRLNNAP